MGAPPYGGEYASPEVHRAARVAAAAHGGQVLCSAAAAAHSQPLTGDTSGYVTWGLFRLRGFDGRERLYQLMAPWSAAGLSPVTDRGRGRPQPARPQHLVCGAAGGDRPVDRTLAAHRLVTLVGGGGAGKTRLAVEVAASRVDEYPDGVWFVDLASVVDPGLVTMTVATTLGYGPSPGGRCCRP